MKPAILALLLGLAGPAGAAPVNVYENPGTFTIPALAPGDPAPPISGATWIGGPPVGRFEPGRVYLVEFFASWCQPCRKSIPELKALARERKGLTVVGVAAAEEDDGEALRAFVAEQQLGYPVAFVPERTTFDGWMQAARTNGLPWVFLVDRRGRVAWWGQPMDAGFHPALDRVLADRDVAGLGRERRAALARERPGWALKDAFHEAVDRGDDPKALELAARLAAIDPERFWYELALEFELRLKRADPAARRVGERLVRQRSRNNPFALTMIGRAVLDAGPAGAQHLDLAAGALERARELTRSEDGPVLRLLARVRAAQGDRQGAAALARKALPLVPAVDRAQVEAELSEYERG